MDKIRCEAWLTPRSVPFSEEEKQDARTAMSKLSGFLRRLWAAQQHSERLMDVLNKTPDTPPEQLFSIRHLIRRFRDEVRHHFAALLPVFSEAISTLNPFLKDTDTGRMRESLIDAMQQLSEVVETYMETFEDFGSPDQVQRLKALFQKIKQLSQGVESVIEGRLRDHFEKNILRRQKIGDLRAGIRRRARLIAMLGA
jgi:ribosomal protein S13